MHSRSYPSRTLIPTLKTVANCYPPPDDWETLRVELTPGEHHLADRLIQELSDDWSLYLQPHIGGTRPDLVLVHPRVGVQIVEVKDYNMGAYDVSGSKWKVKTGGALQTTGSPFDQVDAARKSLFRILLPFMEEARQEDTSLYGFVRAAVYFHNASSDQVEDIRLFAEESLGESADYYGLASRASLEENDTDTLIPLLKQERSGSRHVAKIVRRAREIGLQIPWYEMLHGWLHPTPDEALQNEPLKLTPSQKKASSHKSQRLLVTGPAGSGKTLVLARRTARHLLDGYETLLLGYNITLWHYIRDFVVRGVRAELLEDGHSREEGRVRYKRAMRKLMITHYHDLAYRMLGSIGVDTKELHPKNAAKLLAKNRRWVLARADDPESGIPKVGALLVDEGQDWGPQWLSSLDPLLRNGSPITVVADPEQRIYDHAVRDPQDLFKSAPTKIRLDGTARVPAALLPALNAATDRWMEGVDGQLEKAQQISLDFSERPTPEATWITAQKQQTDCVVAAVREHILNGVNPSQIAVLVPTHKIGLSLESRFDEAQIDYCSLCTNDPESDRSGKHAFWRLDPRLKLSTVHSFKGWEADVVVVAITQVPPSAKERELLYVALTRTRAIIQVVAPHGASDLPAWQHRRGQNLLDSVPTTVKDASKSSSGSSTSYHGAWAEGNVPEPPPPRAPHPAEGMD